MSVTISEVVVAGGYDVSTLEDAQWLLAQSKQWDAMIDAAEAIVEAAEALEMAENEREYNKRFGNE